MGRLTKLPIVRDGDGDSDDHNNNHSGVDRVCEGADDGNDHDSVDECGPLASFTLTDQTQLDVLALTSAEGQPQCCFLSTH